MACNTEPLGAEPTGIRAQVHREGKYEVGEVGLDLRPVLQEPDLRYVKGSEKTVAEGSDGPQSALRDPLRSSSLGLTKYSSSGGSSGSSSGAFPGVSSRVSSGVFSAVSNVTGVSTGASTGFFAERGAEQVAERLPERSAERRPERFDGRFVPFSTPFSPRSVWRSAWVSGWFPRRRACAWTGRRNAGGSACRPFAPKAV